MKMTDTESYLLQQRYVDTIIKFSRRINLSLNEAFHKFYQSKLYERITRSTAQEILNLPEEDLLNELIREYSMQHSNTGATRRRT